MQVTLLSSKGQAGTRLEVLDTQEGVLFKPVMARQTTAWPPSAADLITKARLSVWKT